MIRYAHENREALAALQHLRPSLPPAHIEAFMESTLTEDRGEWCILHGVDLFNDPIGVGDTIPNAVKDFFNRLR